VLNDAIRAGLRGSSTTVRRKRFSVKARPMGLRPGIDPTKLAELADELETEAVLESTRRSAKKKK
jgi:hypothetical protein